MTAEKTKPILRWPGGKARLLKNILPLIPEHTCYCEPFFGGGAVLFSKPRSSVEVINDINGNLVALYRNLQFHLPALMQELDWLFASRDNLHDFIAQPGLTELQRAARFLLVNRTSFGGNMHSFGVAKSKGGGVGFDRNQVGRLIGAAHERLNGVVVENIPYERCFSNYDSPETFFFLDPPYLSKKVKAYDGFSPKQMDQFSREVRRLKGKWIVTVDDCPANRELFAGYNMRAVSTQSRLCNVRTHSDVRFGELIISGSATGLK
ncbi:MAG TPA: DNA adenine methylase [Verrucomicrobiae bacterium]|nr:DNA adenine methylase [Verrucomicrobiae bacterium]